MSDDTRDTAPHDDELLTRFRAGDATAFDIIYLRYYARLVTFVERGARDVESAEDIVQGVFLSLWEHRTRYQIVPPIAAYLYRAVRNRAISARRREATAEKHLGSATDAESTPGVGTFMTDPEQRLEHHETQTALWAAIDQLPARQRLVLRMYLDDRLKPTEIAGVLGVHEQAVRKLLTKAMGKLTIVLDAMDA